VRTGHPEQRVSGSPCLSCSAHALGTVPVELSLVGPDGELLDEKATD